MGPSEFETTTLSMVLLNSYYHFANIYKLKLSNDPVNVKSAPHLLLILRGFSNTNQGVPAFSLRFYNSH